MGFDNFANASGWQHYYGRNEYNEDPRFGGDKDFDGTWAIWDEPFLQYFATKMNEMQQPFVTALFTASSHHPFAIPEQYKELFHDEGLEIHKCIRYTDNALRLFFETASQQPWFKNTIFVITSDHTNMSNHDEYRTPLGLYSVPILIYDPSGELPKGIRSGVAQQIDIMPTLLGILGYDQPYIAFGKDLLSQSDTWAVNYMSGIYQYLQNDTLIQFDGEKVTATYIPSSDPLLKQPLSTYPPSHEQKLKAIIQQYMTRMTGNKLVMNNE
jgi:phosphoglycerol transferase MdoB-like AlkP superfamily enzyme